MPARLLLPLLLLLGACGGGGGGGGTAPPAPAVAPGTLLFATRAGADPAAQTVDVTLAGVDATGIACSADAAWLQATPAAGQVAVAVDAAGLAVGIHAGTLTITAGGRSRTIAVTAVVGDAIARIDADGDAGAIPPLVHGATAIWEDLGAGLLVGGELVQDRSFRRAPGTVWLEMPGADGAIDRPADGDPAPASGTGHAGCLRLQRGAAGQTVALQTLLRPLAVGDACELRLSAQAESLAAGAQVEAFLFDFATATPASAVHAVVPAVGAWTRTSATLTATAAADTLVLRLVQPGGGASAVRVDEVRLWTEPAFDPAALAAVGSLAPRCLRWPGGTLVDTFPWREAVGPMVGRDEVETDLGRLQTPSLGLHEFMALCAAVGAEPILQVNVRAGAAEAAALWRYVAGDVATPEGALRAAHGHPAPWAVSCWELGNEPSAGYDLGSGAAAGYAAQAAAAAAAIAAEDPVALLSAAAEGGFTHADWLAAVPLLADWNATVLGGGSPLAGVPDAVSVHCYSYHGWHADAAERWRHRAAAGTVQQANAATVAALAGTPVWLTEHGSALENPAGTVVAAATRDAASGLVALDQLRAACADGTAVACLHNLSQAVGFGALVRRADGWALRPTGIALQLAAPFPGATRLPCVVDGAASVTLAAGTGNIPAGTSYPELAVLAARGGDGRLRLLALNRSWDQPRRLALDPGATGGTATVTRLAPGDLAADNEAADAVQSSVATVTGAAALLLDLPAHSAALVEFSDLAVAAPTAPAAVE